MFIQGFGFFFFHTIFASTCRNSRAIGTSNCLNFSSSFFPIKNSLSSSTGRLQMENGDRSCSSSSSRGSLIVLEGLDRSGKTSQSARLVSYLKDKGLSVEAWRFPDRSTGVGQMISAYLANESQLDDRAIHLLFSANRWEKRFDFFPEICFFLHRFDPWN